MANQTNEIDEKPKKEKTVTMTTEQLQAFVKDEVSKAMGLKIVKPKRVLERDVSVIFYEDKPVTSLGNTQYQLVDGARVMFADITVLGSDKPIVVEYLSFLNEAHVELMRVIKKIDTEVVKSYGTITAINPDPYNNKTWNGGEIDLDVTSITSESEVESLQGDRKGERYTLPNQCFNLKK